MPSPPRPPHVQQDILNLLKAERRPLHSAEIATRLKLRNRAILADTLGDMVFEGLIRSRPGHRYALPAGAGGEGQQLREGTLLVNPRGFAFVKTQGGHDDVFVPAESIAGGMHGDRVRAQIVAVGRRGAEGEVMEILQRRPPTVAGLLRGRPGQWWLEPDDTRIRGPIEVAVPEGKFTRRGERASGETAADGAAAQGPRHHDPQSRVPARPQEPKAGLAAVVEITRFPEFAKENACANLLAVLGVPGEPDVEVTKILLSQGIHDDYPEEAVAEAERLGDAPSAEDLAAREDLTEIPLLTIDPHDARDHDDAVWVVRHDDGGYEAWIAIADVSHYVTPGSALDDAAKVRGCSAYLPDRAVPMLPHRLSSVLCSLLAQQDRLCLCVHVRIDASGKITRTQVIEGRMRAHAAISYQGAARALGFTSEPARDPHAEALRDDLRVMWDLALVLRQRRLRRGALDLSVPEVRITVDDGTRAPVAVEERSHDPGVRKAYRLVEEMMLLANEAVAKLLLQHEVNAIYRVHGAPDPEKLLRFAAACKALGVEAEVPEGDNPKELSRFLSKVEAHPKRAIVHGQLLRAMQQASYDTSNLGHYGLASPAYLHFTSPIRRYPDLVVHRQVRALLQKESGTTRFSSEEALRTTASTASRRERSTMEAERAIADLYRAIYMQPHVGEVYEGSILAMTPGGIYVRIETPFVDVLVSLDSLGDSYEIDEHGLQAIGLRSGERLSLGDPMPVVIEDVSLTRRTIFAKRLSKEPSGKSRDPKLRSKGGRQTRRSASTKGKGRGRGRGKR